MDNDWRVSPTKIDLWPDEIEYFLFIDENGQNDMKQIIKSYDCESQVDEGDKYFNICAVLIDKNNYFKLGDSFSSIKSKHWNNGIYEYKCGQRIVCFHSDEIRKQKEAFSSKVIDREIFLNEISDTIKNTDFVIFDCFVNKEELYKKYLQQTQDPYSLAIEYLLERVVRHVSETDNILICLEARGKKEDAELLPKIINIANCGTYYVSSVLTSKIKGIYFNSKRTADYKMTYVGLELADLCAYPIYSYAKRNTKNQSIEIIKTKIKGFPYCEGRGLKRIP